MNRERLNRMVDLLFDLQVAIDNKPETVPSFDLSDWYTEGTSADCGTACCAVGYYATTDAGEKDGFTLEVADYGSGLPIFDGRIGYHAVERYFDLSFEEAYHFFDRESYTEEERTSPAAVACRIRDYMEKPIFR